MLPNLDLEKMVYVSRLLQISKMHMRRLQNESTKSKVVTSYIFEGVAVSCTVTAAGERTTKNYIRIDSRYKTD